MVVRKMVNRIFLPRVNALRRREGLHPQLDVMTETWASERLNLVTVSPSICHPPSDWGTRHRVCGFLNPPAELSSEEELPAGLEEFLATGVPPVYFTFGSMMLPNQDYIREAIAIWTATVRSVGCRAVFQLPCEDLSVFETAEGVFKVSRSPYRKVFPKCSLVVHHGGSGTTQSSLLAGCPSVVVAHMADQFFWGSELERLGVAGPTQRRKGLSSRKLANAIAKILASPDYARRARVLGKAMSRENGVEVAVRLIESKLGQTLRPKKDSG
jgi:UDP:flavonoid glycosyltransferase YjiC (YdhE family)